MGELLYRELSLFLRLPLFRQALLAILLIPGVSRGTLGAVENGHVPIDSSKVLSAARILGVPAGSFRFQWNPVFGRTRLASVSH